MDNRSILALAEPIVKLTIESTKQKAKLLSLSAVQSKQILNALEWTQDQVINRLTTQFRSQEKEYKPVDLKSALTLLTQLIEKASLEFQELSALPDTQDDRCYLPRRGSRLSTPGASALLNKTPLNANANKRMSIRLSDCSKQQSIIDFIDDGNGKFAPGKMADEIKEDKHRSMQIQDRPQIDKDCDRAWFEKKLEKPRRVKLSLIKYANGTSYEGEWLNNVRDGQGVETFPNGLKYTGEFKDDEFHGHGVLEYPDGSRFEGEFENGQKHGQGSERLANGVTYEGNWSKGIKDGDFQIILPQYQKLSVITNHSAHVSSMNTMRDNQTLAEQNTARNKPTEPLRASWNKGTLIKFDVNQVEKPEALVKKKTMLEIPEMNRSRSRFTPKMRQSNDSSVCVVPEAYD